MEIQASGGRPRTSGEVAEREAERVVDAARGLRDLPLIIEQEPSLTVSQIGARARKHARVLERQGKTLDVMYLEHIHIRQSAHQLRPPVETIGKLRSWSIYHQGDNPASRVIRRLEKRSEPPRQPGTGSRGWLSRSQTKRPAQQAPNPLPSVTLVTPVTPISHTLVQLRMAARWLTVGGRLSA